MQWSDGEPATSEDARWTYQLVLDAVASEDGHRLGLPRAYRRRTPGVTDRRRRRIRPRSSSRPSPDDRCSRRRTCRSCPSTSGRTSLDDDRRRRRTSRTSRRSSAPGRTRPSNGSPASSSGSSGTRTTGAAGRRRRGDHPALHSADTMVQALRTGEVDYVRGVSADQFERSRPRRASSPSRAARTASPSCVQHRTARQHDRLAAASTPALLDPAFRDAIGYAIDKERLVDGSSAATAASGRPGPAVSRRNCHVEPATPRTFDIDVANERLDAAGYCSMPTASASTRRASRSTSGLHAGLRGGPIRGRASSSRTGSASSGSAVDAAFDQEDADRRSCSARGRRHTADYDLFIWGWGGDVDPNFAAHRSSPATRSAARATAILQPGVRRAVRGAERALDRTSARRSSPRCRRSFYDDAPYHVLFYDSELHAYRTDRFEGWVNQPLEDGAPLFGYGSTGYTLLTPVGAEPAPEPERRRRPGGRRRASPGARGAVDAGATSGDNAAAPRRRRRGGRGRGRSSARQAPAAAAGEEE